MCDAVMNVLGESLTVKAWLTCDIVSCHFQVDASGHSTQLLVHVKEGFYFSPDVLIPTHQICTVGIFNACA